MKTIIRFAVAAIVAMALAVVAIALDAKGSVVLTVYASSALVLSALMGVFDMPEWRNSIRKLKRDAQDVRDAA